MASNLPVAVDGIASGTALVLSGIFPWISSGAGSSLRGVELAAALRSGAGMPDWAPRAALAILAVAAIGVAHLVSALFVGSSSARFRLASGLLLVVALAWVATRYSPDRWGLGLACAGLGGLFSVVSGLAREIKPPMMIRSEG